MGERDLVLQCVLRRIFIPLISTIIESHNGDDATKGLDNIVESRWIFLYISYCCVCSWLGT
jgi:hypothetical protein